MSETIGNFVPISQTLATAGQPTEEQLSDLAAAGYEVIINLDVPDSRFALPDEPGLVRSLGMAYHAIPVNFAAPTIDDWRQFARVLEANEQRRVFVHCAANYRVATFVALYGQTHWNWSEEKADAHIQRLWQPNPTWSEFLARARGALLAHDDPSPESS